MSENPPDVDLAASETSDLAIQVYFAMLRVPEANDELLIGEGFSPAQIAQARRILVERRLIEEVADGFEVPPPEVTLPAYAAELERQARTSRAAAAGLSRLYHRSRSRTDRLAADNLDTRAMSSLDELHRHATRLVATANARVLQLIARSPHNDEALLQGRLPAPDPAQPLIRWDLAVDANFLEVEGALDALVARRDAGARVCLVAGVPFTAVVVDGTSAILDVSNIEPSGRGSVLLRHPPHVLAVSSVLERMVRAAIPLYARRIPRERGSAASGSGTEDSGITSRDAQILSLLAAGASDSTIARQVGVSQRTVERRLRTIMEGLGATTRFQAGAQAVRRGLL